jgi:hypothetical protein
MPGVSRSECIARTFAGDAQKLPGRAALRRRCAWGGAAWSMSGAAAATYRCSRPRLPVFHAARRVRRLDPKAYEALREVP